MQLLVDILASEHMSEVHSYVDRYHGNEHGVNVRGRKGSGRGGLDVG